jgi:hypothetical protein
MKTTRAAVGWGAVFAIAGAAGACDAFRGDGGASPAPLDGGGGRADGSTGDLDAAGAAHDSSCPSCAHSVETLIDGQATPRFVAVNGETIYWALDSSVVRMCKIDSCKSTVTTIASAYERIGKPSGLAVDSTGVYLAMYSKQVIYRIDPGLNITPVAEYDLGNGPAPHSVAVDGAHVVWTEQTPDAVKVRTAAPDAGAFLSNASVGFIRAIALGDDAAIWLSGTAGRTGAHLEVQNDGNLVVYDTAGVARWATGSHNLAAGPGAEVE